jgi:uncharacterized protein (DUF885 family)
LNDRSGILRSAAALLTAVSFLACGGASPSESPAAGPPDVRVRELADAYVEGFFDRFPEQATMVGAPGRSHDKLTDNALSALQAWEAQEDAWLADVKVIDPARIGSGSLKATYAILREALESSVASRVCRNELWNVSQMTGWHVGYGYLITIQPVGTDRGRAEALARWGSLPRYLDTEIANLREGIEQGYTAPRHIVRIVIDQVRTLVSTPAPESPLLAPVRADKTPGFAQAFTALVNDQIAPAARRYADFLERDYLPAARETAAVAANRNGAACYEASIRAFSTLPKSAREVHDIGVREVARIDGEMKAIAEQSFGTGDVPALMQRLRTDSGFMFRNRQQLIDYSTAALDRARAEAPQWFGILPKADVRIEPYPAYRERNAPGEYNPPSEDGSRPGLFYISAYQPEKKSRADNESTAFHETIPGHHLQVALALERKEIHPIGRYIFNSGYVEGWALYAEGLADEMKLFSGELDRLGMLGAQNWRAVRLVVDTGLHALGWTRQQAIDYMLAHTTANANDAASEIDRYIIWPGQATSYMLGRLEILAARDEATKAAGSAFDIKAFHDRVLEDGSVPLTFLREKIRAPAANSPPS